MSRPAIPSGRSRKAALWLGGFLFLCFVYFFPRASDWDQASRLDLALALANDGTLSIDHYAWNTADISFASGHYYSIMAPGEGVAATPLAWVMKHVAGRVSGASSAHAIGRNGVWRREYGYYLLLLYAETVLTVAVPAVILVLAFFWFLGFFSTSVPNRLIVSFGLGLCTVVFPYAQMMYSHVPAALLLFVAFALIFASTTEPVRRDVLGSWLYLHRAEALGLAGLALGLAEVYEYPSAAIGALVVLFAAWRVPLRQLAFLGLGVVPGALIVGGYDFAVYHNPFVTGYSGHSVLWKGRLAEGIGGSTWPPRWSALYGLTLSPYRGMFFISPWLLLALPGCLLLWIERKRGLALICLGVPIAYTSLIAASPFWFAGSTVGPRYLIPALPFLALPTIVTLEHTRSRLLRLAIITTIAVSLGNVWVQTLGRGGYPPESIHDPLFAFSLPGFFHDQLPLSLGSVLLAPAGVGTSKASLLPLLLLLAGWTLRCHWRARRTSGG